ncbi:MAG: hypothetical protein KFF77_10260 [Bacteroidetes bacterium]|nr:hypothetical protein [Bacteroidota bacterium]
MAKTRKVTSAAAGKGERRVVPPAFNLDDVLDRYIWVLVPLLVLLYYWFGSGSTGFYQDDEIGHYRNIRQFWGDPFSIMGNQPKPGWKILMVVPGLFGFTGVMLAHCLVAALTVVMTYKLGRAMKMKNASLAALFLAAQPLYLQLSFRSYSEITAALFIVLSLYFYYRERWLWAALASSYVFSIRQEFALVSIGLGVIFLMRKQWIPFLALAWTPLLLATIGWLATGNIMWMLEDMQRIGLGVEVPHKPFWHYFETYVYMVGPVVLPLFVLGYWKTFLPPDRVKEQISEHGFFFFTFTVMFVWAVISAWDVPNFGANPGHWRYLLSIAPLTAVYAVKGANTLFESRRPDIVYGILGVFTLMAVLFLARDTNGLILVDEPRYDNIAVFIGLLAVYAAYATLRVLNTQVFIGLLLVTLVGFTVYAEKPRTLDIEAETVRQAAEWYMAQPEEFQQRPLYCNHVLFRYFADIDINDSNRDRGVRLADLADAPIGSVIVWESHYGYNQFGGDVPLEYFDQTPGYVLLQQYLAPDQSFGIFMIEKAADAATPDAQAPPDGAAQPDAQTPPDGEAPSGETSGPPEGGQ